MYSLGAFRSVIYGASPVPASPAFRNNLVRKSPRMSHIRRTNVGLLPVLALLLATLLSVSADAQPRSTAAATSSFPGALSQGWAALAAGDLVKAAKLAESAIAEQPRSAAAVALAVEIDFSRSGPLAGLAAYERWLAGRKVEDPYILRRIAYEHLRWVTQHTTHPARLEAAKALTADGDPQAAATLLRGAAGGGQMEARALASLGDPQSVEIIIGQLQGSEGGKLGAINALAESGSKLAIPPLLRLLGDIREDTRAAAADALGRLGASQTIPQIKPLLSDPVFPVRMSAAAALYRLEDLSGINLLDELMASPHASVRLGAAEAMTDRPPASWLSVVRGLTSDADVSVQLGAARLIAPYDPQLAASVLERLSGSDNPAIREEAARVFVERVAGDFAELRRYLRSPDALAVVRAAARIVELTR
ncbi:hypothetical protein BH18ACI5_BH18ACI5_07390 [soil metagenome]